MGSQWKKTRLFFKRFFYSNTKQGLSSLAGGEGVGKEGFVYGTNLKGQKKGRKRCLTTTDCMVENNHPRNYAITSKSSKNVRKAAVTEWCEARSEYKQDVNSLIIVIINKNINLATPQVSASANFQN